MSFCHKFIAAAMFLVVCCVASARPGPETVSPESAATYMEISISNWDIANSFPETAGDDPARRYLEERFGITFRPAGITWGDANEKLNIWAASGQLPDIIGGISTVGDGRYHQWIEDNLVQPLPRDLSGFPNILKYVDTPEVQVFNVGGRTYLLPRVTYEDASWWAMDRGLLIRKDWREELGIPMPVSDDEFIDMCVRFATADPDGDGVDNTVGLTIAGIGFLWSQSFPNYGFTDARWIEDTDGNYRLGHTTRRAFELFGFLRRLYRRGGLDPDFAISSQDPAIDSFSSGHAGVLARQVSPKHLDKVASVWAKLQPDHGFEESVEIFHPWAVRGQETEMFVEKSYWSETYIEASVTAPKMSKILELFDFLYSDEGIALCYLGFEGEDYTHVNGTVQPLKIDQDGNPMSAGDLYPIMRGGMAYQAVWGDIIQYNNPSIPSSVIAMSRTERDYRLAHYRVPDVDWAVQAINVPQKQSLGIEFGADWIRFILDESGLADEQLFAEMKERWRANGYDAAVDAVTAEARRMGK